MALHAGRQYLCSNKNNQVMSKVYPGFNAADRQSALAAFYREPVQPPPAALEQLAAGDPLPWDALPDADQLQLLEAPGYQAVENGYSLAPDGSIKVAVKTDMPGLTPAMWDWWFGWHSALDQRYKLWHPGAHLSARWDDPGEEIAYIGRTSIIKEYIGENLLDAAIQFKSPLEFGFSPESIGRSDKAVYICAKIGHPQLPVDYGYLVHQVRATENGAEMRSRFCLGGQNIRLRQNGKLADLASALIKKLRALPDNFAQDLLRHCAEEMRHLALVLSDLYHEFSRETLAPAGKITQRHDKGFEALVMGQLFNKLDPGQRPALVVEPRNEAELISTVRYAKSVGRRICVSSGGHSFSANFIREDSILILMKHFNRYEVDKENLRAKAGPGVGGSVLMKALYKQQLFFPAGHCEGVCIGGYLLQGGYGWNGRKMGIACQSVIGMEIVTADGELVYADEQQNSDLFWAARGAGPGFFGIVTCFHLKVYPLPPYRAIMVHDFAIKHLESVYRWAHETGPEIPKAVEFQMLMSKNMLNVMGPGIEAFAPIFADNEDEFEEAKKFMTNSPIKSKAIVATPAFNPGIELLYKATMSHYPENHHWGVDNMWSHASIDELLPFIREIAETLPPAPSHFLWLNWHPGSLEADMAYSKEDQLYLALYSCWKNPADTALYGNWASDMMRRMNHLSTGIQLADEGLHKRTQAFMSAENLARVQEIRRSRDPQGLFFEWHSKPEN